MNSKGVVYLLVLPKDVIMRNRVRLVIMGKLTNLKKSRLLKHLS